MLNKNKLHISKQTIHSLYSALPQSLRCKRDCLEYRTRIIFVLELISLPSIWLLCLSPLFTMNRTHYYSSLMCVSASDRKLCLFCKLIFTNTTEVHWSYECSGICELVQWLEWFNKQNTFRCFVITRRVTVPLTW